ncbi:MAG: rhodanese-like domain-containing protein [Bacteriovoracia bacterium]
MTPAEALELVKSGKAVLVDVREENELQESGYAQGALWMPTSEISEDTPKWQEFKAKLPKDKPVILYCRSGNRSGRLAEFLAQDGYETVNLGGFCEWKAAQLPIQKL